MEIGDITPVHVEAHLPINNDLFVMRRAIADVAMREHQLAVVAGKTPFSWTYLMETTEYSIPNYWRWTARLARASSTRPVSAHASPNELPTRSWPSRRACPVTAEHLCGLTLCCEPWNRGFGRDNFARLKE